MSADRACFFCLVLLVVATMPGAAVGSDRTLLLDGRQEMDIAEALQLYGESFRQKTGIIVAVEV